MKWKILWVLASILIISCMSKNDRSEVINDEYAEAKSLFTANCASCHGAQVEMFVDRKWKHGKTSDSLMASIKGGYPDLGMPSFDSTFTDEQVNKLAKYISFGIANRDSYTFENTFNADSIFETDGVKYRLELISDLIEVPWGFVFLPDNSILITDIDGELHHRSKSGDLTVIANVPKVLAKGQGGLLDIELDPFYESNKTIYISYSKAKGDEATTAVISAKFDGQKLMEVKEIFEALPYLPTKHHYGSRLEFDNEGYLYVSVGDRGRRNDNPQSLDNHCGKIHRINKDGSIPEDNPFVNKAGAMPSIWSYGHRNPQGLFFDNKSKVLWEHEHGPRGGDELNIISKGKNYGWPLASFGLNYNGTTFTTKTEIDGMKNAEKVWVPSIAPCGMAQVKGNKYPAWEDQLLVASLRFKYLAKVAKDGSELQMLKNIGRMRNVKLDREGYIYVSTEEPGRIYKLIPVKEG